MWHRRGAYIVLVRKSEGKATCKTYEYTGE